jgi:hypothetical protein
MDTVTRTFPIELNNSYVANSILEFCHFRDMIFDSDERVAVYLESFFCNLNLKSFNRGIVAEFDGSETEAEKMAKFSATETRSQKVGLRILGKKNNTGNWQEKAEIILVNRGRKDYFDLLQPYLAKSQVRVLEKNDALAIQLIDYGNGLLTSIDSLGIEAAFTITISKKNDIEQLENRLASLELAINGRLTNISPNHFLGREISSGVIQQIPFTRFATQSNIDQAVLDLVGGAPGALNTLIELAAALNNDANFASNVTNQLASKAPLNNPSFTGFITLGENIAIKCKAITGTTSDVQGGTVSILHGLIGIKIVAINGVIRYAVNGTVQLGGNAGSYSSSLICDGANLHITNTSNNSGGILSKAFIALLWYVA